MESTVRAQIDAVASGLDQAIDDVEKLFRANAITAAASYHTMPLDLDVHVLPMIADTAPAPMADGSDVEADEVEIETEDRIGEPLITGSGPMASARTDA